MNGSNANWQRDLLARLPEPIRRDAKKSAVLGGLLVVMFGVMAKQFIFTGGPASAAASDGAATPAGIMAASTASANRIAVASDNRRSIGIRQADPVERWLLEHVRPLDRNPFEFHPEFFPNSPLAGVEATSARVVEDEMFWDRLAKSIASRADQRKQRQIRIENLQVAAGKLRVQSTILGSNPRVLIAGKMNSVGDTVEAESGGVMLPFRIVRIEGRRIILEREGVKLELPMGATRARVIVDE